MSVLALENRYTIDQRVVLLDVFWYFLAALQLVRWILQI